jgi:hypothetical protein
LLSEGAWKKRAVRETRRRWICRPTRHVGFDCLRSNESHPTTPVSRGALRGLVYHVVHPESVGIFAHQHVQGLLYKDILHRLVAEHEANPRLIRGVLQDRVQKLIRASD